jgi:hypothetical protein
MYHKNNYSTIKMNQKDSTIKMNQRGHKQVVMRIVKMWYWESWEESNTMINTVVIHILNKAICTFIFGFTCSKPMLNRD